MTKLGLQSNYPSSIVMGSRLNLHELNTGMDIMDNFFYLYVSMLAGYGPLVFVIFATAFVYY